MSGLSGACTPLVFANGERRHSSSLFYGAPCWALVLCSSGHIAQLDGVLALASRLAFGLERTKKQKRPCQMFSNQKLPLHFPSEWLA